ncbi:MAG: hypothetical protein PT977_04400 [Acidobacteriota bacterium]|nr:hypothetical protein [Acidobacteriota bacterium]
MDELLEALGLERRPPDTRFFEDLFLRFQRRVANETLTRPSGNPGAFDAEAFFGNWVEEERGLVGEERARAFAWLAGQLGFACELESSFCFRPWETVERDEQRWSEGPGGFSLKGDGAGVHRAVIARIAGRHILADAGFPLPVLLPLDAPDREFPTGFGTLTVKSPPGGDDIRITCDARGEETELLRVDLAANPPPPPLEEIRRPLPGASPPLDTPGSKKGFALRVLDDRVLFWRAGRMTILDAWSLLDYPLPASERAAIEKIFALELEGILLPEEPLDEVAKPATLSVFHLSPVAPLEAKERVGRDPLPLILVSSREERVEEAASGGSRITIRATLADVPPEGPGEAVRKTLVFHLVSELFELSGGPGRTG